MKKIVIEAPKHPVVRYRFVNERRVELDMRGIRNLHSPMNGRVNPSKGTRTRWLSPEHLQCMVDEYFESCNGPLFDNRGNLLRDDNGNLVKGQVKPYTVSGLALYLGISTQTLKKYREGGIDDVLAEMRADTEDRKTFSRVVLEAKQRIEAYAEGRLYDRDGQRGAQFVLDCQFGWVERKPQAEIDKFKAETQLKRDEFELKKSLLDDEGEDKEITINVIRGRKSEEG